MPVVAPAGPVAAAVTGPSVCPGRLSSDRERPHDLVMPPREGVLERDRTCWGFPCKAGTRIDPVWRSGTLAHDFAYRGVVLPEGSTFFVDDPLDVAHVTLARATSVHGRRVAGGSTLELAPLPPPLAVVYTLVLLPLYPLFAWRRRLLSRGTRIDRDAPGNVTKAKIIDVDVALYTHRPDIARRVASL